jgi:hypothetical protein
LPPDLRDDPTLALTSYNWILFGAWEFDAHRRAGFLGDVDFFARELDEEDERDDEEDKYEDDEDRYEDDNDEGGDIDNVQVLGASDNGKAAGPRIRRPNRRTSTRRRPLRWK